MSKWKRCNMSFYKDYKVNEGLLILTDLLKILYMSKSIVLPNEIFNEVKKLYELLIEYEEGEYLDNDIKNETVFRRVYYK